MNIKSKIVLIISILIVVLIICMNSKDKVLEIIFMSATYGPLSMDEALDIVRLPIYSVKPESKYSELNEVYYFFDDSPELTLATYFITHTQLGEPIRVAKMVTYNVWSGPEPHDSTDKEITIIWVRTNIARGCKFLAQGERGDRIYGEPYQSCFYWFDENNQYILYTIWTEEETEEFVNSLIQVE